MKFNIGKTFLLGFGFFGVSVIWSVYNAFVPIFLADRFLMAAGFIGFFMTLDNIAALLIQPAVGSWSDRIQTRIGRRMPFIIVGAPLAAISFILLPISTSLWLFFLAAVMLLLSMAIWRTPVVALMPDITPSKYRSQANGIINLMGGLGAIIAFLGGAKLYEMDPTYPFYLGAGLVALSALLVFVFIKEPKVSVSSEEEPPNLMNSLRMILKDKDKSAVRILLAIFFWFIAYNGIEAFFTLYAKNHLGLSEADGSRLLGQLSLLFVLFSLPSGYIGAAIGRKKTISIGLVLMALCVVAMFVLPVDTLTITLTSLPALGVVPVIGLILMVAGVAWSLININSLPMVVDMTEASRIGTFTGLYYLFSTLAAITGPILYGLIIQLSGNNYSLVMLVSPIFFLLALLSMRGVSRGEALKE
ncbi:MAG: maltose/moltooligosaccharide transporter [Chloroflexota bacterium]|nr:maltose/moltooligosaccharide transporter [Chloroflexota bacterium]